LELSKDDFTKYYTKSIKEPTKNKIIENQKGFYFNF
jgi:hypothetical protein